MLSTEWPRPSPFAEGHPRSDASGSPIMMYQLHLPQSEMSPARRNAGARVLPAAVGNTRRRSADPLLELRVGARLLRRSASGLIHPASWLESCARLTRIPLDKTTKTKASHDSMSHRTLPLNSPPPKTAHNHTSGSGGTCEWLEGATCRTDVRMSDCQTLPYGHVVFDFSTAMLAPAAEKRVRLNHHPTPRRDRHH